MTSRPAAGVSLLGLLLAALLLGACTGGTESNAAEEPASSTAQEAARKTIDPAQTLGAIHPAIPLYAGAKYRDDLTQRDAVMIRNRYGANAEVYTLATDDSFPQVYHYYTTYLAQFRGFPADDTYPSSRQQWRTLEVQLNRAMQDPFVPGLALDPNGRQVTLQLAETEASPKTVIRYIVTDRPAAEPAPVATASHGDPAAGMAVR